MFGVLCFLYSRHSHRYIPSVGVTCYIDRASPSHSDCVIQSDNPHQPPGQTVVPEITKKFRWAVAQVGQGFADLHAREVVDGHEGKSRAVWSRRWTIRLVCLAWFTDRVVADVLFSAVCLEQVDRTQEIRELRCLHVFHRECLEKWFLGDHFNCPLCHRAYYVADTPPRNDYVWMVWPDTSQWSKVEEVIQ